MSKKTQKTRYVRIKLDYVIDVGRDVDVLPPEVMAFLNRSGGTCDLVFYGLDRAMPKPRADAVRLLLPVHRAVSLWHPKKKRAAAQPTREPSWKQIAREEIKLIDARKKARRARKSAA